MFSDCTKVRPRQARRGNDQVRQPIAEGRPREPLDLTRDANLMRWRGAPTAACATLGHARRSAATDAALR